MVNTVTKVFITSKLKYDCNQLSYFFLIKKGAENHCFLLL